MKTLHAFVLDKITIPTDSDELESFYDWYWQLVLDYPLIFLPENKIIFWGFEVKLLKNEYDLLKSIIKLNTETSMTNEFTEEQIVESIDYKRINSSIEKLKSYQRFITTSMSNIKRVLLNECTTCCINRIEFNLYNPFIEDKVAGKVITLDKVPTNNKSFREKVLVTDINLTKIFTHMLNFTSAYDDNYSSFILKNALTSLISSPKGQKHNSEHRFYTTEFVFNDTPFTRSSNIPLRLREKDDDFKYAKTTPTRYNLANFINYPKSQH